jgi:hypothetical protein
MPSEPIEPLFNSRLRDAFPPKWAVVAYFVILAAGLILR